MGSFETLFCKRTSIIPSGFPQLIKLILKSGHLHIQRFPPVPAENDKQELCENFRISPNQTTTKITFRRKSAPVSKPGPVIIIERRIKNGANTVARAIARPFSRFGLQPAPPAAITSLKFAPRCGQTPGLPLRIALGVNSNHVYAMHLKSLANPPINVSPLLNSC